MHRHRLDDRRIVSLMPCPAYRNITRRATPSVLTPYIHTVPPFIHRYSGITFQQQQLHVSAYPQLQAPCRFQESLEQSGHRSETIGNLDDVYLPFDRPGCATQHLGDSSPIVEKQKSVEQYEGGHISEHSKSSIPPRGRVYSYTKMNGYSTPPAEKSEADPGPGRMAKTYIPGTVPHDTLPPPSIAMHPSDGESKLRTFDKAKSSKRGSGPIQKRARSSAKSSNRDGLKRPVSKRETWQVQKDAISSKFGSAGWTPRKRLSPDALEGIRALHAQFPDKFSTPVLANQFEVSAEAIRRILKSKWRPSDEEATNRRQRWDKRGERIWGQMVALGVKPPKKWREVSHGHSLLRLLHALFHSMIFGSLGPCHQLSQF